MEIRERLRQAREELGLTLVQVAEAIEYSHSTISNAETGKDGAGKKLLNKLIDFYGIRPQWLEAGHGQMLAREDEKAERARMRSARKQVSQRIGAAIEEAGRHVTIRDPEAGERHTVSFASATDEEWRCLAEQVISASQRLGQPSVSKKIVQIPLGYKLRPVLGNIAAGRPQEAIVQAEQFIVLPPRDAAKTTFVLQVRGDSMIDKGIIDGDLVYINAEKEPRSGDVVVALCDHETCLKTFISTGKEPPFLRAENKAFPRKIVADDELLIQGVMVGKHHQE